jgi:ABC-type Na+ efflux pump permease subunit
VPDERPGYGGIWSTSFDVMGSGMSKVPVKLDFTADVDTMVCALGFSGTLPGGLSQAFPVINKKPPSARGRQLFTYNAPEGMPCEDDEVATLGMYHIVGSMLVLALCVAFLARFCSRKRKQRKALQVLMAHSECEGLVDGRKRTGYTDDI